MQKIKRFSVYWFDPQPTIGSELRKVRPAIVVSPDEMNNQLQTVLVAPLTSTDKPWPFRANVTVAGEQSSVACDQLRVVDKSRLINHITDLGPADAKVVLQTLRQIFSD